MKQPKKPTRAQKEILRKKGLNEKDYMVLNEDATTFTVIPKKEDKDGNKKELTFKK